MSNVEEIKRAVSDFGPENLRRFREWFADFDAKLRNRQIEGDLRGGRCDALLEEGRGE